MQFLTWNQVANQPFVKEYNFSEIEWIRQHYVERNIPGSTMGEDELRSHVYAELQLRNKAQVKELETHLAVERQTRGFRYNASRPVSRGTFANLCAGVIQRNS